MTTLFAPKGNSFLLKKKKKNQVPLLVYKDFWHQERTNQMQPSCATWPIRFASVV